MAPAERVLAGNLHLSVSNSFGYLALVGFGCRLLFMVDSHMVDECLNRMDGLRMVIYTELFHS